MEWEKDYYKVLCLKRDASKKEIANAYKGLAEVYHPDKTILGLELAAEKMAEINEAYEVLSNKRGTKAAYDAWWDKKWGKKDMNNDKKSLMKRPESPITKYDENLANFNLNKKPQSGKSNISLAQIVGIATVTVLIGGLLYIGIKISNPKDLEEKPPVYDGVDEDLDTNAMIIKENWNKFNSDHGEDEIKEMIKCINGQESSLTLQDVDNIVLEMISKSLEPAVNNQISLLQGAAATEKPQELDLSSLILDGTKGQKAVEDMEDYLNGMFTNPSETEFYSKGSLIDQATALSEGGTLSDFTLGEDTPNGVKLIWIRLAQATNTLTGFACDESMTVSVNEVTYTMGEITDYTTLDGLATSVLGKDKQLTMNKGE